MYKRNKPGRQSEGIHGDRRQSAAAWLLKLCLRRFCKAGLGSGGRTRRRGRTTNVKINFFFPAFVCFLFWSLEPKTWQVLCLRSNYALDIGVENEDAVLSANQYNYGQRGFPPDVLNTHCNSR